MTMAPDGHDFIPRKHLHRLSWIFAAFDALRPFVFPLIAVVIFGVRDNYLFWGVLLVVPLVIGAIGRQWIYRYGFGPRGLVIREGLFFRNVRTIDYDRIENVDTERKLLHRLLGVAEVRVETSSGGSSEAVIRVLDLAAVAEMRERIFSERGNGEAGARREQEEVLLHLGPGELIRYGVIDNRGMVVVAAVFGLLSQGGTYRTLQASLEPLIDRLPFAGFAAIGPLMQGFFVLSTLAALVVGTRILSVVMAFVTLHDFRLVREDEDLRIHHGLVTKIALTMRRPRIQAVHSRTTLLHRLFRRVSLRVDLAGGFAADGGQDGQQATSRKSWLAPLCTPEKAEELLRIALPGVQPGVLDWQRLSPRAHWRLFRVLALAWLAVSAAPAVVLLGWWAPAGVLPVIPAFWLYARMYVKYTGWVVQEGFFAVRSGWLTRRLSVVPCDRIQSTRISESPFDRRYRMAGLGVDTAGAGARRLRIPYLDADVATALVDTLSASKPYAHRGAR